MRVQEIHWRQILPSWQGVLCSRVLNALGYLLRKLWR